MDSKVVFLAALRELELHPLQEKFIENGWDTFGNFAFCTADPSGKNPEAFEKVIVELLATDGSQKSLIPRLRRLYALAYATTSSAMADAVEHKDINTKVSMHPQDRAERTDRLRARMTGFALDLHNQPSATLTDRFATVLAKGVVQNVPWENARPSIKKRWICQK